MDYMVQERERGITITSGMSVIHMGMAWHGRRRQ
jgi:translation elongation factor EF-G